MKIVTALLLLISMPLLADYPLEIIELKSRPVNEVIPLIKPFIDRDGSIAGMNNQLIVRTSEKNLREIRNILDRIDRPPRRLMIYVRQGAGDGIRRGGVSADINAMVGNDARVVIGQPGPDNSVRFRAGSRQTQSDLDVSQRVQTLEGQQAFISVGTQVPVKDYNFTGWGPHAYGGSSTVYKNATTGFYVLPRLSGDRVTLQVSPHMVRPRSGERFDFTQASTVLSGRLGEWMTLGGSSRAGYADSRNIGYSAGTRNRQDRDISIRVEELQQ